MNEKKEISKREKIKSVAIVFLCLMLILTFFSNTILNYSLPEVSTGYAESGIVAARVRGTGTVTASDPYEVIASETRTVSSVKVKVGDTVKKDDVLLALEDCESDELIQARADLADLQLQYELAILEDGLTVAQVEMIESDSLPTLAQMQTTLSGLKGSEDSYQATIDGYNATIKVYQAQIDALDYIDESAEYAAVSQASATVDSCSTALATAKTEKETKEDEYEAAETEYTDALSKKTAYEKAQVATREAQAAKDAAQLVYEAVTISGNDIQISAAYADLVSAEGTLSLAQSAESAAKKAYDACGSISTLESKKNSASSEADAAASAYQTALNNKANADNTLATAQAAYSEKTDVSEDKRELFRQISDINIALASAELSLSTASKNYTDTQKLYMNELTVANQYSTLCLKQSDVEELEAKAQGATVNAPLNGTVSAINVVAGEKMQLDTVVITILPEGKELTVSLSVTADQAAKVKPGDEAEITGAFQYEDASAVISQIKNDPNNPGKKLIVFSIGGDIPEGTSIELTVGDKSSTYNLVVPLTAIKEDKNGTYVLQVVIKDSPLGNRYYAQRVNVTIIVKDDKYAAVQSDDLEMNAYVVTTSSKPVKPGDQIRLKENTEG